MSSPLEEASTVLNGDEKSAYPEALLKLHAVGGEEADVAGRRNDSVSAAPSRKG